MNWNSKNEKNSYRDRKGMGRSGDNGRRNDPMCRVRGRRRRRRIMLPFILFQNNHSLDNTFFFNTHSLQFSVIQLCGGLNYKLLLSVFSLVRTYRRVEKQQIKSREIEREKKSLASVIWRLEQCLLKWRINPLFLKCNTWPTQRTIIVRLLLHW